MKKKLIYRNPQSMIICTSFAKIILLIVLLLIMFTAHAENHCEPFAIEHHEDFSETSFGEIPDCWYVIEESDFPYNHVGVSLDYMTFENILVIDNINDDALIILVSPEFTLPTNQIMVRFAAKFNMMGVGWKEEGETDIPEIVVGVMDTQTDAESFYPIKTIRMDSQEYREYEAPLIHYPGNGQYIAFKAQLSNDPAKEKEAVQPFISIEIQEISFEFLPSCLKPGNLSATDLTATSAMLSWSQGHEEAEWDVLYGFKGFDPEAHGTLIENIETTSHLLEDIQHSTFYDFYVRAKCGGTDISEWQGPHSFATLCSAAEVPIFDDFGSYAFGELPYCWSNIIIDNGYIDILTGGPHLRLATGWNTYGEVYFISPEIAGGLDNKFIRLNVRRSNIPGSLIIGTMTDPTDETTFTAVLEFTPEETFTWYEVEHTFEDFDGPDTYIALKHAGTNTKVRIDDILIDEIASCPIPEDFEITDIGLDHAWLNWDPVGEEQMWEIAWGMEGVSIEEATIETAEAHPFQLTDLEAGTYYDVYVRAFCQEDDQSHWVGPINFITACYPMELSIFENFDGDIQSYRLPNCWESVVNSNNPQAGIRTVYSSDPFSEPRHVRLFNAHDAHAELVLITPEFEGDITSMRVSFRGRMVHSGWDVHVGSWHEGEFHLQEVVSLSPLYSKYFVDFSDHEVDANRIAFKHGGGGTQLSILMDDILIEETPDCPEPHHLRTLVLLHNRAVLHWVEMGNATSWDIEYGETGFEPGTGTLVSGIESNSHLLLGLEPSSTYDFYVRAVCNSSETSIWSVPYTFSTTCTPVYTTITETFDDSSIPDCWWQQYELDATEGIWGWISTNQAGGDSGELHANRSFFTGVTRLVAPTVNLENATTANLSFRHFYDDYGPAGCTFKIQTSDNGIVWQDTDFSINSGGGNMGGMVNVPITTFSENTYIAWVIEGDHRNFWSWSIDNVTITSDAQPDTDTYTLTINTVGNGTVEVEGELYTEPLTVDEGTFFGLLAVAEEGWEFAGWSGDLESDEAEESILMDSDKTITATFTEIPQPDQFTLTINIVGNGTVEVEGELYTEPLTVEEGTFFGLLALEEEGWEFAAWSGDLESDEAEEAILMDSDKTITATFTEIPQPDQFTLTINIVGSGTVEVEGELYTEPLTVDEGTFFGLLAVADEGWEFAGWSGDLESDEEEDAILMDSDKTITATFTEIPQPDLFTLTINIVGSGTVEVEGELYTEPLTVDEGTFFGLLAVAEEGWEFAAWSGDLESDEAEEAIMMDSDKTITLTFTPSTAVYNNPWEKLYIYPNPFGDNLWIKNVTDVKKITLTNILGHVVLTKEIPGDHQFIISTSSIEKGFYLLHLINSQGETHTVKLIKN